MVRKCGSEVPPAALELHNIKAAHVRAYPGLALAAARDAAAADPAAAAAGVRRPLLQAHHAALSLLPLGAQRSRVSEAAPPAFAALAQAAPPA